MLIGYARVSTVEPNRALAASTRSKPPAASGASSTPFANPPATWGFQFGEALGARVAFARISSPTNDPLDARRVAPERSLDQRINALRRANEVRTLRAQLKRDLKADRVSIGALLLDPPPYLQTAKVFDMLLALPKYGRVKATKILHSCRVSPSKTFGGLTERQRTELARRLDR